MAEPREPVDGTASQSPRAVPAMPPAAWTGAAPRDAGRGRGEGGAVDRGTINLRWARALVDGLVAAGVEHVVVCPGSRSSPLALAAARHPGVRVWVQLDERSAGFFALGIGRATGRPAAVVATSGTAPANFYPAVIEARYGRVPLVVLSADRPHELRDFGASQTVDQIHLYGRHAKWFCDLPLPEDDPAGRAFVTRAAVRAVTEALAAPAGPVHLNVPFREPLVPGASGDAEAGDEATGAGDGTGEAGRPTGIADGPWGPGVAVRPPGGARAAGTAWGTGTPGRGGSAGATGAAVEPRLAPAALADGQAWELLGLLAGARRGLIVCGPVAPAVAAVPPAGPGTGSGGGAPVAVPGGPPLAVAVTRLARRLGLPVLADPLSGVRWGPHLGPAAGADAESPIDAECPIIDAYDAFLRDPALADALAPDVVLRIGAPPVSKPLAQYLERHAVLQIVLDEGGWPDPAHVAARVVRADPARACQQLAELAERLQGEATRTEAEPTPPGGEASRGPSPGSDAAGDPGSWLALWRRINRVAREAIARQLAGWDEPAEPRVVAELARLLPPGSLLVAGNSMPIRDVDTFVPASPTPIRCLANRGASGIDGVVSTAAGVAAAGEGPAALVIGDLSFYHDLNGLWAAARYRLPLVVVVVNNDGGGIFSFLPQARLDPEEFEALWGTPHGLDFRHAAALYGIPYRRVRTWDAFRNAVREALAAADPSPGFAAVRTAPARPGDSGVPDPPREGARRGGPVIVEVRTDRRRNVDHHRQVWRAVAAALAEAGLATPRTGSGPTGPVAGPAAEDGPGSPARRSRAGDGEPRRPPAEDDREAAGAGRGHGHGRGRGAAAAPPAAASGAEAALAVEFAREGAATRPTEAACGAAAARQADGVAPQAEDGVAPQAEADGDAAATPEAEGEGDPAAVPRVEAEGGAAVIPEARADAGVGTDPPAEAGRRPAADARGAAGPVGGRFVRVRGVRYYLEAAGGEAQGPSAALPALAAPAAPAAPAAAGASRCRHESSRREPALLLHGFTGSTATWAPVWDELAAAGPLLAVDLLGHGRTAAPADPRRYRMEEQVADLLALLDRLGCHRVHLVGYSMGGRVALGLAAAAPDRVASLVLESSSPGLRDPAERAARRRADEELARRIEAEGVESFARHWEGLPLFAGLRRLPPALRAAVRATRLNQRPQGLANSLRGIGAGVQPPLWDRLPALAMPVLCLAGAADAKYAALAAAMAACLPRGRAVTVPGAGHTVHLEDPAGFVREVRAFWEAVRR